LYLPSRVETVNSLRAVFSVNSSAPGVESALRMVGMPTRTVVVEPTAEDWSPGRLMNAFKEAGQPEPTILDHLTTPTAIEHEIYGRPELGSVGLVVVPGGNAAEFGAHLSIMPNLTRLFNRIILDPDIIYLGNSLGWVICHDEFWTGDQPIGLDFSGYRFEPGLQRIPGRACAHCHGDKRTELLGKAKEDLGLGEVVLCAQNEAVFTVADGMITRIADGLDTDVERILQLDGRDLSVTTLRPHTPIPLGQFFSPNWLGAAA
jgi:hypothetical protein